MLKIAIPGRAPLALSHLVLDYNGTLASQGRLIEGLVEPLGALAKQLTLHVVTADTFGSAQQQLAQLPLSVKLLPKANQDHEKARFVTQLGASQVVAMGNGHNDALMLQAAALGVAILGPEGLARTAAEAADLMVGSIHSGLALLLEPRGLVATLRA